jgi:hypothetical protein
MLTHPPEVMFVARMTDDQRAQRALLRARREAVAVEEDDGRLEERRQQWHREGSYLTRAEVGAGELCRGCGEPLLDGLGDWCPLNQLAPADRAELDRAEAGSWSVTGRAGPIAGASAATGSFTADTAVHRRL